MGYEPAGGVKSTECHSSDLSESALVGIYEISKLLASPTRLEQTLAGVLATLSSFLAMRHGLIALINDKGDPEIVVGSGWTEDSTKKYFELLPERAVGQIVTTKMPVVIENVATSALFAGSDLSNWIGADGKPVSLIGVPIKNGDAVVGTMTVDRAFEPHSLTRFDHDVRFLTMVANLLGQTLRLHNLVARDRERLMLKSARLEKGDRLPYREPNFHGIEGIIGESAALQAVIEKIRVVAKSNATVFLRGESGTGKELFAAAIHNLSRRRGKPFIKLNCAALPESVLESELFGHERGAFTGAATQRKGRFELADGGTLFLDEIGEITPAFQAKLLRVLQEGEFERVGGSSTKKVDVRFVCATNCNLESAVQKGEFRADLYYRISVVPIYVPPLRDRDGDVALLANEFLRRFNAEQKSSLSLSKSALSVLNECGFPGNIRELENCITRTATLARGETIIDKDFGCRNDGCLSAMLWKGSWQPVVRTADPSPVISGAPEPLRSPISDTPANDDSASTSECPHADNCSAQGNGAHLSREKLINALERSGWVKAKAARLLGLTPRQVGYALQKYSVPLKRL
jgi:Nif-specific regulatory protein